VRARNLPWSVYALRDPHTNQIRYVGWSVDPVARLKRHMKEARTGKTHKCRWLACLGGIWPRLEILESGVGDPAPAEIRWIAEMRRRGADLTNATAGGDGVIDPTPELRRLRSELNKGRRPSEETRKKLAEASHRRPVKDTTRAKLSAILKARYASDEERRKTSRRMRGRNRNAEFREMRRKVQTGKRPSNETRQKMSAAHRERHRLARYNEAQLCLTLSPLS
jgi:hypothetical protein